MTDLKPGDLVVCVDDGVRPGRVWGGGKKPIIAGNIYTVRDLGPNAEGDPGVRLEEVRYDTKAWGKDTILRLSRFRPIRKPSIEVLRRIVERAPDEVRA